MYVLWYVLFIKKEETEYCQSLVIRSKYQSCEAHDGLQDVNLNLLKQCKIRRKERKKKALLSACHVTLKNTVACSCRCPISFHLILKWRTF